eukprot:47539-Pelagomonas_calceolata.AAC.1
MTLIFHDKGEMQAWKDSPKTVRFTLVWLLLAVLLAQFAAINTSEPVFGQVTPIVTIVTIGQVCSQVSWEQCWARSSDDVTP